MDTIKARVHMLPTEWGYGVIYSNGSVITIHEPRLHKSEWTPQNLYITTDEEIKEGDWFINTGSGGHPTPKVYQANSENSKAFKEFGPYPEIRKIIATTDPKLFVKIEGQKNLKGSLPQIPQSFIEEYCKAGGIDEVLVEYDMEYCTCLEWKETYECPNHYIDSHTQKVMCSKEPTNQPKLKDNTIIIHPVEEKMYSRDEVESLCRNAHLLGMKETLPGYPKPETIDKWIEENL